MLRTPQARVKPDVSDKLITKVDSPQRDMERGPDLLDMPRALSDPCNCEIMVVVGLHSAVEA